MRLVFRITLAAAVALAIYAQDGADTYGKCATCHGPDGAGKTAKGRKLKVKDVRETVGKVSVAEMTAIVEKGKGLDMPAYSGELTKPQIGAVVEYYRGLAKK